MVWPWLAKTRAMPHTKLIAMTYSDLDDLGLCDRLMTEHGCNLCHDEDGWVLSEPTGGVRIGNVTETEAKRFAGVYVYLYYVKGVEFTLAQMCAHGVIGHLITHQEWLARWDDGEDGKEARRSLTDSWSRLLADWVSKYAS